MSRMVKSNLSAENLNRDLGSMETDPLLTSNSHSMSSGLTAGDASWMPNCSVTLPSTNARRVLGSTKLTLGGTADGCT